MLGHIASDATLGMRQAKIPTHPRRPVTEQNLSIVPLSDQLSQSRRMRTAGSTQNKQDWDQDRVYSSRNQRTTAETQQENRGTTRLMPACRGPFRRPGRAPSSRAETAWRCRAPTSPTSTARTATLSRKIWVYAHVSRS